MMEAIATEALRMGAQTTKGRPVPRVGATGRAALLFVAVMTLGACAVPLGETAGLEPAPSREVLTRLNALAASYQDLSFVRLRPEDGCYWYRHVGPVETTMLPLRTVEGRTICNRRATPAPV
ncbi:hypothetical protein [uncultured Jannaschia sp.]|uniref:hypothetical protein n=1 Tax=uncultured Jannaschia sp. TaxID=293347 RepID=UPI00341538ED